MHYAASRDVVDVWKVHIARAPHDDLAQVLTAAERAHAARYVQQRDRDRFISVRAWLRRLLGAYLDESAAALTFEIAKHGKPALVGHGGPDGLRFNVSHSGEFGLIAVCRGREVGVDVEEIRHDFDVIELGRTCFSLREHEELCACAPNARVERFFQLWTAKEACIKALGGGLSIPLQDFTVCVGHERDRWRVTSESMESGITDVIPLSIAQGYRAAVTVVGPAWQLQERDVSDWES